MLIVYGIPSDEVLFMAHDYNDGSMYCACFVTCTLLHTQKHRCNLLIINKKSVGVFSRVVSTWGGI